MNITLEMRPAARIQGKVDFEGDRPQPSPQDIRSLSIALERADKGPADYLLPDVVGINGRFVTSGAPPGEYYLAVRGNIDGWFVDSAKLGGIDCFDTPVTIGDVDITGVVVTLTTRSTGATVTGKVSTSNGWAKIGTSVVLFPAESMRRSGLKWPERRVRSAAIDSDGGYSIVGVPPGDYWVVALPRSRSLEWQLELPSTQLMTLATRVRLQARQTLSVDLKTQ
jgi:hypothetical protein